MEQLLSLAEASTRLNIPIRAVYRLVRTGQIDATRVGTRLKIKESALVKFLDSLPNVRYSGGPNA